LATLDSVSGGPGDIGGKDLDVTKDTSATDGSGNPVDVVLDTTSNQNLYVINTGNASNDATIVQVQLTTQNNYPPDTQNVIARDATNNMGPWDFQHPAVGAYADGDTWDPASLAPNKIAVVVDAGHAGSQIIDGHVSTVDPSTGTVHMYTNQYADHAYLATVGGMIVYSSSGGMSPTKLLVNPTPTANATLTPAAITSSSATASPQPQAPPVALASPAFPLLRAGPETGNPADPSLLHARAGSKSGHDAFFSQWESRGRWSPPLWDDSLLARA
jgi:hypothetical protein